MKRIIELKNFIDEMDEKEYSRYILILVSCVIVLVFVMFFTHRRRISKLKKQINIINRRRRESRDLLERHEIVQNQKREVDLILSKNKTFKIKEYFSQVLDKLKLHSKSSKETEISTPADLDNGYSEIMLNATFTNITMQELCGLLYEVEKNSRIYLKELSMVKASNMDNLGATLVIATLQPKTAI